MGLDALPTYKRVVAWFPGHAEDTERYLLRFRRLNQGLNPGNGECTSARRTLSALCSESALIATLEKLKWRPFSGVAQDIFSLLGVKPEGKNKKQEEEATQDMVSTISFIQANVQHNIAASRILTRTVSVKGIDMALIRNHGFVRAVSGT